MASLRFLCVALLLLTVTNVMTVDGRRGCLKGLVRSTTLKPKSDSPSCKRCACIKGEFKCKIKPGVC
ncbi:hypothetical protein HOLleu_00386 [Holothuria leucospilota]|uniref:Uncharacterized protein n=1 Tax=Holothuria leucospilota TaxID=206669 RepID=A0A9Q1CPJ6_HOLLE|nr:hypothetical protein HOLleu_00386 [Holothuria leucospilota]